MNQVKLYIEAPDGDRDVALDEELTIGRTDASDLVLADSGLSRKNTTFFRQQVQWFLLHLRKRHPDWMF